MSALVLTLLICIAWAGITALGYIRGGWREIVTLAAILLAYAVASEWAGPNGRDLAEAFGGNTFRSTTTIALAYLFVGTALFGYFGGSRLPRPIPLSATERFVGGAVGFFNGGILAALTLRVLHAYAFAAGSGRVLVDASLARWLIADVGYLLVLALLVAVIAPFLSFFLVRQPSYTAEYEEDPALQHPPAFNYYPEPAAPPAMAPPPMYAPPQGMAPAPMATEVYPAGIAAFSNGETALPAMPATSVLPAEALASAPASALVPTTPLLPRAVPIPTWPTPALPAPAAQITRSDHGATPFGAQAAMPASPMPSAPAPISAPVSNARPSEPARPGGPPGMAITASQPLPTIDPHPPILAGAATPPAGPPSEMKSVESATPPTTPTTPSALPASTIGPAPFTAQHTVTPHPSLSDQPHKEAANPIASAASAAASMPPPAEAHADAAIGERQPGPAPTVPTKAPPSPADSVVPPIPSAPRELVPAAPEVPQKAEMAVLLEQTPEEIPAASPPTPATNARVARARVATARPTTPPPAPSETAMPAPTDSALPAPDIQRPVQPGPNMHPCPVCDYPVRNGARFCPNCGSAQPRG